MVYFANRNGMYNTMASPNMSITSAGLPTGSAPPMAQSDMANPGGADVVVDPNAPPSAGFIPASDGTIAPYNPATGESGYIDEAQRDAYERFTTSPDYLFRFNEGQRMLDSSAAARGTLMSGNQLRALTELGQNLASGEYGNYMNRLYGVAGLAPSGGQGMALQGGSQGFNQMFNAAGSLGTNLGNIAGAQGMATQNAWGSALGNIDFGAIGKGIAGLF